MALLLNALSERQRIALSEALPAHVDPSTLMPEQALELLWRDGLICDEADARRAVMQLARAELAAAV